MDSYNVTVALFISVYFLDYANHNFIGVEILFGNDTEEYRLALHELQLWPVARPTPA